MSKSRFNNHLKQFECLESRQLMAADIFRGNDWVISGTDQSDNLVIQPDPRHPGYLLARNGSELIGRAVANTVRRIRIHAGAGDDVVANKVDGFFHKSHFQFYGISINAGDGNDKVVSVGEYLIVSGGSGNDTIYGTRGHDTLVGGDGDDSIIGGSGRDSIEGNAGNDNLVGGHDNDYIVGGAGKDEVTGGMGRDWIDGSSGRDQLYGGYDRDTLIGGKQADLIELDNKRDVFTAKPEDAVVDAGSMTSWKSNPESYSRSMYANTAAGSYYFGMTRNYYTVATSGVLTFTDADSASALIRSDTNVQVSGIDEADTIENDGNYIYSVKGSSIVITDIRDPSEMKIVSQIKVGSSVSGMYLDGDKLTVISSSYSSSGSRIVPNGTRIAFFDYAFIGEQQINISTYDITDRAAPAKLTETSIKGNYTTSRYIDGKVYLVSSYYEYVPQLEGEYIEDIWVPESEESYQSRLADAASADGAMYTVTAGNKIVKGSLGKIATDIGGDPFNSMSSSYVTLIDTRSPGTTPQATYEYNGYFQTVYMTANSIYLATPGSSVNGSSTTQITKLSLANSLALDGKGAIDGMIRSNQFAFDEAADGTLRVTTQVNWNQNASTNFTVLRDTGESLEVVGSLTGLAKGEDLYATRYIGDRAYLVTYGPDWSKMRFADPLYVIDTSDAENPELLGELKIPGYSQYLHPADETHLIGLGQRDDDEDGRREGLQLSLFDVSDPAKPQRVGTYDFSTLPEDSWSYSSAEWNHLAFTYVPQTGMLAVPFYAGSRGTGLEILKVNLQTGFDYVTTVSNKQDEWTDLRGVFVGEHVFAVGEDRISSVDLNDPTQRDSIDLPAESAS